MKSHLTLVVIAAVCLAALFAASEASLVSEVKTCSDEWSRCVEDPELEGPGIPFDKCSMR